MHQARAARCRLATLGRLRSQTFKAGDLLLMQGLPESIAAFASGFGCVPPAERELRIPDRRKAVMATLIMAFAIAGAAFGLVPAAISFAIGVLASMALRTVALREVYSAVDWPVIVLLAALSVNADPYLMAVAVGASCAFLTPIGHQNNTLILGPGGFHFGGYWRLGLPLQLLVIAVSIPMLLVWPF